jgi:hypothetical protein
MQLVNGALLTVQLPQKPSFLEAQRFEEEEAPAKANGPQRERRYVGYLPGQTLTVEGTWEGNDRLTARVFYAGTPDDYLNFLTYTQPGGALMMGAFCSVLGIFLLLAGGVLRLLGQ